MQQFTLYRTSGAGNAKNTVYPIRAEISDPDALCEALRYDHVCAKYKDDRRSEANYECSDVIPMDCDNDHSEDPAAWKTPEDVKAAFPGVAFGVGYSRNHMKEKHGKPARPKFHVYFPIQPVSDAKQYATLKQQILQRFPWFDGNAVDAARFYFGSADNGAFIIDGKKTVDQVLPKPITSGSRNATLSKAAGRLIKRYGNTDEARMLFDEKAAACIPPLERDELQAIWSSAAKYGAKEAAKPGYVQPETFNAPSDITAFLKQVQPENSRTYTWTDIGGGYLFADCFQRIVRYVPERKCWYKYENGVWAADSGNLFTMERCKELANELIRYALTIMDEQRRQEYLKYCTKWQNRNVKDTILKDAQSVHPILMNEFDADPYVFNCKNGTLHLDTMAFTEHSPEDKLTKISGVSYRPEAKSERFSSFIDEICSGDQEKGAFLQKAFGYGISGDTRYECLFILYGAKTRNGKGTLCESVLKVLGSYGCASRPEMIGMRMNTSSQAPSEDIARLAGVRFTNISEPSKGLILNSALVKSMTGNDTLNARFLHENSFDFRPQFKIYINTNYRPTINDMTLFTSHRVIVIPFERQFDEAEQDKYLKTLFAGEDHKSAILNWLIEGYMRLRREGLNPPDSVKAAIQDYQQDSDKITQFVDDVLVEAPAQETKTRCSMTGTGSGVRRTAAMQRTAGTSIRRCVPSRRSSVSVPAAAATPPHCSSDTASETEPARCKHLLTGL